MNSLILVKHSLPEIVEHIPASQWNLSDEGKRRARVLADRLRYYQPEVILTSVEPKAMQTAEILANALQLAMQVAANLHEHERNKTGFLSQGVFEAKIQEFFENPDRLVLGNETADQAHDRFRHAIDSLVNRHRNQNVVMVAHGTVISLFVSRLTGLPAFLLWKELGLPSYIVLDRQSHTILAKQSIT